MTTQPLPHAETQTHVEYHIRETWEGQPQMFRQSGIYSTKEAAQAAIDAHPEWFSTEEDAVPPVVVRVTTTRTWHHERA